MQPKRRDIFLKIERVAEYSPLAPILCSRHYGRDCMLGPGHESGRIPPDEIMAASLDALVYREYLDPAYTIPNKAKIVEADANEPPWDRRVPGAVIYARPGERLYIHVLNADPERVCHSFHLHGLHYGIDSDGAWPMGVKTRDGRRSDEIKPGQTWTYVFDATADTIGAWAFHDHVRNVQRNVNRGLFGGLIVRDPAAPCADHEIPLFLHQLAGAATGVELTSPSMGTGATFSFPFPSAPGTHPYHCRIHGVTMAGQVQVIAGGPAVRAVTIGDNFFSPAVATVAPGGTVVWTNTGASQHIVFSGGGGASTFCINGRAFAGNTPTIETESRDRLRWFVFNLDFAETWHNFHPHSSRWQLPGPPGGAADVHSLSPAESFVADTEAPPAVRLPCALEALQCEPPADACRVRVRGDYLFHCHAEAHMMMGLVGLLRARDYIWVTESILKSLNLELPLDDGRNECAPIDVFRCETDKPSVPNPNTPNDVPGTNPSGMPGMPGMTGTPGNPAAGASSLAGLSDLSDLAAAPTRGLWELLPCDSQVLAVHAALMHTGKILFFAGSGNDPDKLAAHDFRSVVWDYENGTFHRPVTPIDFFCAGQTFLPDGRLLVAGGTKKYDDFLGLRDAYLFDPITEDWIRVQDMADGRWYPTLVSLGNGTALAVSGLSEAGPPNRVPEVYSQFFNWRSFAASGFDWPTYPHLFLLRDGRIFYSGGQMGGTGVAPGRITLPGNTFAPIVTPASFVAGQRDQSASVLLPPAQDQKVMILGGGGPAINNVNVVDLKVAAPAYVPVAPLHFARMHVNAVILPDRTVLATGGSTHGESVAGAALHAEIYHPTTNTWTIGAKATVPRVYHSVALLLPDGRVITAGSNPTRKDDELRLELYHPPYLFKGHRPFIETAPASITWGGTLEIHTPQAASIQWISLIRPMATTHSEDSSQRLVDIPFERKGHCTLVGVVPREPNLAPPGWYMLFICDHAGVPSVAKWVHLAAGAGRLLGEGRTIAKVRIHPAIGIARLGNSPEEHFVGPELPGDHTPPVGGYKDASGRIKRQAARFRLFGYDEHDELVGEVTSDNADITWTVHLANKKSAGPAFDGAKTGTPLRNKSVKDRASLVIDPGARSLKGAGGVARFDGGKFLGKEVALGEMRTDESGRLLVLGGAGQSESVPTGAKLTTYANNDQWHDDVSDGPLSARVLLNGSETPVEVLPAWVICAPPDFAPALTSAVTLYDTLAQVAVDQHWLAPPVRPSFTRDVYPILERATATRWVSAMAAPNHRSLAPAFGPRAPEGMRKAIFARLRDPALGPREESEGDMPMLWGDNYHDGKSMPLTRTQYEIMRKWAEGEFVDDWEGKPPRPALVITPAGLDRAALEACVGGPFYPGIEASWHLRDTFGFSEPFRLRQPGIDAGDVTKQMAVPWQADFNQCAQDGDYAWWPAQRPDDVIPEGETKMVAWTRDWVDPASDQQMVDRWHKLGFVVQRGDAFVETERAKVKP